jgi:hypothetical protein
LVLGFPLPVRNIDREQVVARSAQRLRDQDRIWLDWSYRPFIDAQLIADSKPQWHYINETDLNCHLLDEMGFERLTDTQLDSRDWRKWFDEGNVYVVITTEDLWHHPSIPGLRFHVQFHILGGQGYRLQIYRCLLGTFTRYRYEWSS